MIVPDEVEDPVHQEQGQLGIEVPVTRLPGGRMPWVMPPSLSWIAGVGGTSDTRRRVTSTGVVWICHVAPASVV